MVGGGVQAEVMVEVLGLTRVEREVGAVGDN